ncbi:MAG TPA: aldehyde dehydrogenase family protein [bacterium]|nr:aldehyde dehydrogenase family protein [bacterium]
MSTQPLLTADEIRGVSPLDLSPLPPVKSTTPTELAAAVKRARAAQPAWEALGFEERARLLKAACRRMLERRAEAVDLIRKEAGKSHPQAMMTEAIGPLDYLGNWIKVIRPFVKRKKLPISPLAFPGKKGWVDMVPRGVVALIAPWNYPVATYFKPLLPALLTGNTVVVKPSEYTPRSGLWFQKILAEFLPAGVVEVVIGGREAGQAVLESGVDAVVFTGSSASGRKVLETCAKQMIPCNVELGGKDAALVLADCNLERTIAGVVQWGFQNAGQDCGAIERVYVVDAIADRFVDGLAKAAARLRYSTKDGNDYDVGPLSMPKQLEIVEEHVRDAVAKGAKLLCGGKRTGEGLWFQPTVLDRCNESMKVVADETFGPVVPVIRVKDVEEAIRKANDNPFGLNASIWSEDRAAAAELGKRLQVGTVFVNNHAITGAMAFAPWTGVKESGYGIATGEHSLIFFTRPKTTVVDRGAKPDPWWLPMDATMSDIGERLAQAQLGNYLAAAKVPGLMKKRVAAILKLVRGG